MMKPHWWLYIFLGVVLTGTRAQAADDLAVRPVPDTLFAPGIEERLAPELIATIGERTQAGLIKVLETHHGDAWARGQARAQEARMERELENLLHLGMRYGRVQVILTHYGKDKTVVRLVVTGTMFVANLGNAEVLASRTYSWVQEREEAGLIKEVSGEYLAALVPGAVDGVVAHLGADLAARYTPGVIEARVAGYHKGQVIINRGYMDGAYAGEVYDVVEEPNIRVYVRKVQEHLSIGDIHTGKLPSKGSTLRRLGVADSAGNSPRVMVMAPDPDRVWAPMVSEGEFAQWLSDQLGDAGFAVVPSGTDYLRAQLAEASIVNVSADALVGAQRVPDVVVIPRFGRNQSYQTRHEETGSDLSLVEFAASCAFLDVHSGAVLYGTATARTREDIQQDEGRRFDLNQLNPGLAKDIAVGLAAQARESFVPRRARGTVVTSADAKGEFQIEFEDMPFGPGTIAEITARGTEFSDPQTGRNLGSIEEVVGTARILPRDGQKADREKAQVVVSTVLVGKGHRVRAVVGTANADYRIAQVGTVSVRVEGSDTIQDGKAQHSVESATLASGAMRAVLPPGQAQQLLSRYGQLMSMGLHEAGAGKDLVSPLATHRLDVEIVVTVGPIEESKKEIVRVLRADISATLMDVARETPTILVSPKGDRYEQYPMWQKRTLEARKKKGQVVVGFADADMPAQIDALLFEATTELLRRLRIMADAAQ